MQSKIKLKKIWHCSNIFKIKGQKIVADKITKNSFANSVFFCNSGSEATETSIKVARKYFLKKAKKKKELLLLKVLFMEEH